MDVLRYTNPPQREREQFKIIKPAPQPGFDDTATSIKESISQANSRQPSPQPSPKDDVVINFHSTENAVEGQTNTGVTTIEANLLSRVTTMGNGAGDNMVTLADEIDPANIIDDTVLLRMINNMMFYILRINTISLVVFGLLTLTITWNLSYFYPIGFLWVVDFFELLQMLKHSRRARNSTQGKLKRIWLFLGPITKTFTYAGSKGLIVLYISFQPLTLSLSTCLAPAIIYEIISSCSAVWNTKQKIMKKAHFALLVAKTLIIFTIMCSVLKVEGQINWNWREVFLGYWILFGFLCGLTVVAFLCVINRCCVFFFAESEQFQVHGVIWALFIFGGKTALSCIFTITVRGILEKNLPIETFVSPFFVIMTYNLTMLLFSLGYYNEIETFYKSTFAVQEETEQTQNGFDTKGDQPKKLQKIVVPKFLTKSSSTYYRISTDNELKEVKEKRKKKQAKAKAKLKAKESVKEPAKSAKAPGGKEPAKRIRRDKQQSVDYTNVKQATTTNQSPKHPNPDMLITIAETDQDKGSLATDIDKRTSNNNRADKGRDFFSSLTNRTGVLGIVPSVVRRLGLEWKGNKGGYEEHEDVEDEHGGNYGHMSCDIARQANRSAIDSKREEGNPANIQLRTTGRGQLGGDVLRELEEKVRSLEARGRSTKNNRMAQSLYLNPKSSGNLNLSGVYDQENPDLPSADSSFVEDAGKANGDISMKHECLICFDNKPDAVFMDCGHGGVCYECAVDVWKAAGECYLCRNKIVQVLQIDLQSKLGGDVIKVLSSTQMINWDEGGQ